MKFKRMAVAAAALTGFMVTAVPASAVTIPSARGNAFAGGDGDPLIVTAPSASVVTMVDDGHQVAPSASFADELYDLIAPLTFAVDALDDTVAVGDAATTIGFTPDRGTIVVRRRAAGASSTDVSDASILPEAATWATMLIGFVMIGFGMRYGIRRSNAKFDLKVQRIAAGLDA